MIVVGLVVYKVLAIAAVAVQREKHLVRLLVVVVFGQGDKVFAGVSWEAEPQPLLGVGLLPMA